MLFLEGGRGNRSLGSKEWFPLRKTMDKENMMGTMPERRLLFKLAMPMIFSVLVSSLYNIVDSIFVGRIGQSALTAISLGAPISSLMVEISFGVAIGVNALLSRKLGEKDNEGVSSVAGQGFLLMGAVYVLFLAFGLFGVEAFYRIQTDDTDHRGAAAVLHGPHQRLHGCFADRRYH